MADIFSLFYGERERLEMSEKGGKEKMYERDKHGKKRG
jgi:hypothetical protein